MRVYAWNRGVSPVIGVILLVAVTVVLSAVIGAFALDIGQQSTSADGETAGVSISQTDNGTTIRLISAADVVDRLIIKRNGTTLGTIKNIGGTEFISHSPGSRVTVIAVGDDGSRSVVESYTMEDTATVSDSTPILTDGLFHRWDMEDSSTQSLTDSVGETTLYANGTAATYIDTLVTGDYGIHSGVNGNHSGNGTAVLGSNPRTVTMWVKVENTTNYESVLVYGPNSQGDSFRVAFNWNANDAVTIDAAYSAISYNGSGTVSEWHHYAYVVPNTSSPTVGDVKIYQDGTLLTDTVASYNPGTKITTKNSSYGLSHASNVSIDDVRVYSRALNQTEVKYIYNNTK